jgi:hypothetical protein
VHNLADIIGAAFLGAIAMLAIMSVAVTILRLLHRQDVANKITQKIGSYLWLLNLGGGAYRRDHRHS